MFQVWANSEHWQEKRLFTLISFAGSNCVVNQVSWSHCSIKISVFVFAVFGNFLFPKTKWKLLKNNFQYFQKYAFSFPFYIFFVICTSPSELQFESSKVRLSFFVHVFFFYTLFTHRSKCCVSWIVKCTCLCSVYLSKSILNRPYLFQRIAF